MTSGQVPKTLISDRFRSIAREVLAPLGYDQQLSIPYRLAPGSHRAFVLMRTDGDFPIQDIAVATQVQVLLRLLDRQCQVLSPQSPTIARELGVNAREQAVLQLLAGGLTAEAMAHRLQISPRTAHRHLDRIYHKLHVQNRVQAVLVAHEGGLIAGAPDDLAATGQSADPAERRSPGRSPPAASGLR